LTEVRLIYKYDSNLIYAIIEMKSGNWKRYGRFAAATISRDKRFIYSFVRTVADELKYNIPLALG